LNNNRGFVRAIGSVVYLFAGFFSGCGGGGTNTVDTNKPNVSAGPVIEIETYLPTSTRVTLTYKGTNPQLRSGKPYLNIAKWSKSEAAGLSTFNLAEDKPWGGVAETVSLSLGTNGLSVSSPGKEAEIVLPRASLGVPIRTVSGAKENVGDLDGDGIAEVADVNATVTLEALEAVSVPAGEFKNALKVVHVTKAEVTLSKTKQKISEQLLECVWYAKGVGPIKLALTEPNSAEVVEELVGMESASQSFGVGNRNPSFLNTAFSDTGGESAGKPTTFADATGVWVVSASLIGERSVKVVKYSPMGALLWASDALRGVQLQQRQMNLTTAAASPKSLLVVADVSGSLFTQTLDNSGSPKGELTGKALQVRRMSTSFAESFSQPALAFGDQKFLLVYNYSYSSYSGFEPSYSKIKGQFFDADGLSLGEPFDIETGIQDSRSSRSPTVTYGDNKFLVAWEANKPVIQNGVVLTNSDIVMKTVSSAGTVDTNSTTLATSVGYQTFPAAAFSNGVFAVTWLDGSASANSGNLYMHMTRISSSGQLIDGDAVSGGLRVSQVPVWRTTGAAISAFNNGFLLAYPVSSEASNAYAGIYMKKIGSTSSSSFSQDIGLPIAQEDSLILSGSLAHVSAAVVENTAVVSWVRLGVSQPNLDSVETILVRPTTSQ
jgi:hypothetical protein